MCERSASTRRGADRRGAPARPAPRADRNSPGSGAEPVAALRGVPVRMHDDDIDVGDALVRHLLATQMPDLADLPLIVVEAWGTDNAIWRVGSDLVVRLPRIHWAAGQAEREATWLPQLAPHLPVAVPEPVAVGEPGS